MAGSLRLCKLLQGEEVEINRTGQRGVYAGAFNAFFGADDLKGYTSSMYVLEPSTFFVLDATAMATMMNTWFPMAVHLIEGFAKRRAGPARRSASANGCLPWAPCRPASRTSSTTLLLQRSGRLRRYGSGSPGCVPSWRCLPTAPWTRPSCTRSSRSRRMRSSGWRRRGSCRRWSSATPRTP